jgi:hypothetical protein
VPVDSKTDMPRDEVKIVSIDVMDAHDSGNFCIFFCDGIIFIILMIRYNLFKLVLQIP